MTVNLEILINARAALQAGDFARASALSMALIDRGEESLEAYHILSAARLAEGDWGLASRVLLKAISLFPKNAVLHANLGIALQESGESRQAIEAYEVALKLHPMYGTAWFNLGTVFHQTGEIARAANAYYKSLEIEPHHFGASTNLQAVLQLLGKAQAPQPAGLNTHKTGDDSAPLVKGNRPNADTFVRPHQVTARPTSQWLGAPLIRREKSNQPRGSKGGREFKQAAQDFEHSAFEAYRQDHLDELTALCEEILKAQPNNTSAWAYLGIAKLKSGHPAQALEAYTKALSIDNADVRLLNNAGAALVEIDATELARKVYETALIINPGFADSYNNLGALLHREGKYLEAIVHFNSAINLKPDFTRALLNRGISMQSLGDHNEALNEYDKVLSIDPVHVDTIYAKASVLEKLGALSESVIWFDQYLAINNENADAFYSRGIVKLELGDFAGALDDTDKAMLLAPGDADFQLGASIVRLVSGALRSGFLMYESRRKNRETPEILAEVPCLTRTNSKSLVGKRVAIFSEQGFGDSIQFVRFAHELQELGAHVTAIVQKPLVSLIRSSNLGIEAFSTNDRLPAFDFACPMMSLPLFFGTESETIPSRHRYLHTDHSKQTKWQRLIGAKSSNRTTRIGIAWSGNPVHKNDSRRSISLEALWRKFLSPLPSEFEFHLIQRDVRESDRLTLDSSSIIDHSGLLIDFEETAALCECLDIVISVDTSVAHLCGALGRPTLLMLPFVPDWRWLLDRPDSPWYPSMTLFRQAKPNDWDSVFCHLRDHLIQRFSYADH